MVKPGIVEMDLSILDGFTCNVTIIGDVKGSYGSEAPLEFYYLGAKIFSC